MKKLRLAVLVALQLTLCLCVAGVLGGRLAAQTTYGSIVGTVTDASGAAVADAQVTLTNLATTEKRVAQSGADGLYDFVNLLPGRYSILAEKTGFKRITRPEVIVEVGQAVRIDVTLQVGDVNQTIEVTSETPFLQAETSSIGQVVDERKANELPLNGRNVFNLITLAPAVIPQGSSGGTPVGVNPFGWGNYQVNGSFGNESAEYLDGQPLNIGYINLPVLIPTQDSVQEFKVQTSNLGADWGKFSGGVINLSTKSGGNGLHGEAYEYLRNKVLNANDFFLNKAGQKRPPFTQNQFGANAGGPLVIPHVYDGRDKTFWFFSWEGFRLRVGSAFTTTVPDPKTESNFAGGNFSSLCKNGFTGPGGICADTVPDPKGGPPIPVDQIYDPCGTPAATTVVTCASGTRTPFPGNIIPTGRLNPTSLALLKFFPAATGTGTPGVVGNNFFTNNYTTATSGGGNQNQVVGRLDHALTNNQHIFFRYSYWNVLDLPVDPLGTGLCADRCAEKYDSSAPALGYNWTVTPNTIVSINASLSRFAYNRAPKNSGFDLTTIGWPAQYNAAVPSGARTPPTPCIFNFADNITCSQGQSFITDRNTQWNLSPSVTLVRGHHTVKLGFQLEIGRDNYAQTNVGSGAFAFCGSGLSCFSSFSFADFMLGYADNPSSVENHFFGQAVVPALVAGQQIYRGFYVDDTFRVTNKLTLNLGIRYELQGPWSERFNRQSEFDPTAVSWLANPGVTANLPNVPGLPGLRGDVSLVNTSQRTNIPLQKDNVSPRVGFAYSWDQKTVIRGGYGIFWVPNYVSFGLNPNNDFVNDATTSYTGTIDGNHPVNTINTPFLPQIVPPVGRSLGVLGTQQYATQVVQNFTIADYHDHPAAYVQQWNLNIQRNLPWNFFVSAAYVGSKGTHLALYDSQIDQLGDNFFASAAPQCAAQSAAIVAYNTANKTTFDTRCSGTPPAVVGAPPVTLLQPVANPFFDATTQTSYALSGPTTTNAQLARPYPQFTGLKLAGQGDYDSIYHSLQLTVERRFASAGSLLVAYTNSKLITNADTLTNWLEAATGSIQDFTNLKGERSLSSQDVPQRLVISYVLDLPFGHGKRYMSTASGAVDKLVSGWGIDGVTVFQKGFPLVFTNGNPNYTTQFGGGSRPNYVPGCRKGAPAGGTSNKLNEWFNTACFTSPADFTFGNESRTDANLRGSGVNNFDFALFKRTRFGPDDRLGLEFRTEFFNLFNRTQFAPPNTSVGSANFGVVTNTAAGTTPRLIQFGLKFIF